jgi:predicted nuclease with TOPRIM domain
MTMKNEERIEKLEARIVELEEKVNNLSNEHSEVEERLDRTDDEITALEHDTAINANIARAVAELQEELQRKMPNLYFINKIDAPTMVGQQ